MTPLLTHYLEAWALSDAQPLATTRSSHVYTVTYQGAKAVLKILTSDGHEEKTGAIALRCFNGEGAVYVYEADDQAQLLEYVDGHDLVGMVKAGQDEEATAIIAEVLNKLHTYRGPLPNIDPLDQWFRELFKKAEADRQSGIESMYIKGAEVAQKLLAHPRDRHVLHGDMHHENVRHHVQRGWLAFDPKGLVGERTYDAANTLCNPVGMTALVQNEERLLRNAGVLSRLMGIDMGRILQYTFAYTCLSASWHLTDDSNSENAKETIRLAAVIEPHLPRERA
jgi:streptomycin 6-kinase